MIILQGPASTLEVTTVLPDPEWEDSFQFSAEVNKKKSMNNVDYTYVKETGNRKLTYTIRMRREKSLELIEFIGAFFGKRIQMTNHLGETWRGYILDATPTLRSFGRVNEQEYTLEFEGVKIA